MKNNVLPNWHQVYADDLERYPALLAALKEDDPIGTVAGRAKLSEIETRVLRMWAAGDSERDTGLALGRSREVVREVLLRAKYKILLWLIRWGWVHPDSLLVEGPMNAETVSTSMDLADDTA